ncbi:MFS transporter [Methylocella sp.]|uniref:MFS transporter n=1 Tax=Methylocella sp. TaxID=1978226 RepID=UPI003782DDE2
MRLFIGVRLALIVSMQMQNVAVGWSLYVLTNDPMSLGVAGLVEFVPSILFMLWTGAAADRLDRRRLVAGSAVALALASLALMAVVLSPAPRVGLVYLILFVIGSARAFALPALAALLPNLVTPAELTRAVALTSSSLQAAIIVGPAIGGALLAFNETALFALAALLNLAAALMALGVRPRPQAGHAQAKREGAAEKGLSALLGGFAFVRADRLLLGAISLDLFAVLFGGVTALLPIFARDILAAGPIGLGALRACPAVGAIVMGIFLSRRPLRRAIGPILFASVAGYGAATLLFALSNVLWLSAFAMVLVGGFDMLSMVIRMSVVQLGAPDAMRGRVNAINYVFISASNHLGEFESSLIASFAGARGAALFGGAAALAVTALWSRLFPELYAADRMPEEKRAEEKRAEEKRAEEKRADEKHA